MPNGTPAARAKCHAQNGQPHQVLAGQFHFGVRFGAQRCPVYRHRTDVQYGLAQRRVGARQLIRRSYVRLRGRGRAGS